METISQPTANPTNKLSAATIGAALVSITGLMIRNLAPEWYDPDVFAALMPIVVFGLGYLVRDKPNVIVVVDK